MTLDEKAWLIITLCCVAWTATGAALVSAWGTVEELFESFLKEMPPFRAVSSSHPRLVTAFFMIGLVFMAMLWPFTMRGFIAGWFRKRGGER